MQQKPKSNLERIETAVGSEFHRLATGLLSGHVMRVPIPLSDERGSIQALPIKVHTPSDESSQIEVRQQGQVYRPQVIPKTVTNNDGLSSATSGVNDFFKGTVPVTTPPQSSSQTSGQEPVVSQAEAVSEGLEGSDGYPVTPVRSIWSETILKFRHRWVLMAAILLLVFFPLGGGFLLMNSRSDNGGQSNDGAAGPLALSDNGVRSSTINKGDKFSVNLTLEARNTLIVSPTTKPESLEKGQIFLDQTTNKLFYYDGNKLHELGANSTVINNNIQGPTNITNSTIVNSFVQTGVTKLSGTSDQINVSSSTGNITLSLPQDIATTSSPTFAGLNLGSALQVAFGGTGATTFAANSLLLGNGTGAIQTTNVGTSGQCLVVNGSGVPTFQSCPGSGSVTAGAPQTPGKLTKFDTTTDQIVDSLVSESGGTITVGGDLSVTGIVSGDGSGLTGVDAAQLNGQTGAFYRDASNLNAGTVSASLINGSYGNITGVGTLISGYIDTGFGTISTGNNITTTATIQGGVINATSVLQLNGVDINTAGTLSNVAYLNQDQIFTGANSINKTSATAFQIQNDSGAGNLFIADTISGRIGIGTLGPGYSLDVQNGDINTAGIYRVNGAQISSANLSNDSNLAKINGANIFTAANTFSGTVAIQGANSLTLGTASNVGSIIFRDGSSANTATLQVSGALSGDVTFGLPVATGTQTICTIEAGNCAGSGSGVTTSGGTPGRLAVFTGSQALGDSSIADDGSTVTVTVGQVIQGSAGLTIGDTGVNGKLVFRNGSNSNTLTLQSGVTTSNLTLTLPTGDGANGDCLKTNGLGVLSFTGCTGGAGGGVTSVNTLTGVLNLVGTANQVDVSSAGDTITLSLPQDINTSGNANFRTITLTGQAAGDNLIVGNAVSGATGTLLDLQVNNISKLTVDASGNVNTTGQYQVNGSQISSADLSNNSNLAKLDGTGPQTFTGDNKFTGTVLTQLDSPVAFQIQNGTGTSDLFVADTTTTRIGIGNDTPGYTLDVNGDINTTGVYRINGVTVCSASGCTAASGSGDYIQNGTAPQTADFNITGDGTIGGNLAVSGNALFKNSTDSTTAFQIQDSSSNNLFTADTQNAKINIGRGDRLFVDDFESGDFSRWDERASDNYDFSTNSTYPAVSIRDGSSNDEGRYIARFDLIGNQDPNTNTEAFLRKSVEPGNQTLYLRSSIYVDYQDNVDMQLMKIESSSGWFNVYRDVSTGELCMYYFSHYDSIGDENIYVTECSAQQLPAEEWHRLEAKVTVGDVSPEIELYYDGAQIINAAMDPGADATAPGEEITNFYIGHNNFREDMTDPPEGTFYADDIAADIKATGNTGSLNVEEAFNANGTATFNGAANFNGSLQAGSPMWFDQNSGITHSTFEIQGNETNVNGFFNVYGSQGQSVIYAEGQNNYATVNIAGDTIEVYSNGYNRNEVNLDGDVIVGSGFSVFGTESHIFSDNFESGNFNLWDSNTGNIAMGEGGSENQTSRYLAEIRVDGAPSELKKYVGEHSDIVVRAYITDNAFYTGDVNILNIYNSSGDRISVYRKSSDGTLCLHNEITATDTCGSVDTSFNPFMIVFYVSQADGQAGFYWINGDEDEVVDSSGVGSDPFTHISLGDPDGSGVSMPSNQFFYDNIKVNGGSYIGSQGSLSVADSLFVGGSSVFSNQLLVQNTSGSALLNVEGYNNNVTINIPTGSSGEFRVQNNGTDVLQIGTAGQLQLDVQGDAGGLLIGGDANLYRGASGQLNTDGSLSVNTNLGVGYDPSSISGGVAAFNGGVGVGTDILNTSLTVYNGNESTTQTDFTQSLTKGGINIVTDFTDQAYTPGLFWSTQDNNSAKPKAGIYMKEDGSLGTSLLFGTSDTYSAGITNTALTLGPKGEAIFTNGSNSSTGFQVQNSGGTGLFTINTSTGAALTTSLFIDTLGSSGTTVLCLNGSSQVSTCSGTGAPFIQGGNSFGATAILGTNDSNNLAFETDNVTKWLINTSGNFLPNANDTYNIGSDTARVANLYLGGETLHIGSSTSDEGTISYNNTTDSLIFKNATASPNAFQVQNASGEAQVTIDTNDPNYATLNIGGTGTDYSELGFFRGGTKTWQFGTDDTLGNPILYLYDSVHSNIALQFDNTTNAATFKNASDSSAAFEIQNADGDALLTADTENTRLNIVGDVNVGTRFGSRLLSDNFESGNLNLWDQGSAGASISTSVVRDGKYSALINPAGTNSSTAATIAPSNEVYIRTWVYVDSQTSSNADLLQLGTAGWANYWVAYRQGGSLHIYNGVTTSDAGSGGSLTLDAWHLIEMRITTGAGTGISQAWLDGTQVVNATSQNNGTDSIVNAGIGDVDGRTFTSYFDDVVVDTESTGTPSSLSVDDSFHVGGTSNFGSTVQIQSTSEATDLLIDGDQSGEGATLRVNAAADEIALLQLYETNDRGFNLFYDGSSNNQFVLQANDAGSLINVLSVQRSEGGLVIGALDSPTGSESTDLGSVRIVGAGEYGGLGRLLFGDGDLTTNQNVWIGEFSLGGGTDDTDILELHGKNAVLISTGGSADQYVGNFSYDGTRDSSVLILGTSTSGGYLRFDNDDSFQWSIGMDSFDPCGGSTPDDTLYFYNNNAGACALTIDNGNDVDINGDLTIDFGGGTSSTNGVCHSGADIDGTSSGTNRRLLPCNNSAGDIAEWYEVKDDAQAGDIVITSDELFSYQSTIVDPYTGIVQDQKETKQISKLEKSTTPYQQKILGIISTNPAQVYGADIKEQGSNPKPIALTGRVPVNVSPGSEPIQPGDYLTTSGDSGKAMKATSGGFVIGKALEGWSPGSGASQVMVLVEQGYWPGPSPASTLQNGGDVSLDSLVASSANINQLTAEDASITNLTVGTATIATLHVTGAVQFDGPTLSFSDNVRGVNLPIQHTDNSIDVSFDSAYPDTAYAVQCTPSYNTNCYVTDKTIDGFKINFGNAPPDDNQKVDWFVLR